MPTSKPLDRIMSSAPTYAAGQHSRSTEYTRLLARSAGERERRPLSVQEWIYAAALSLSPVLLLAAYLILTGSIREQLLQGPAALLLVAAPIPVLVAGWQLRAALRGQAQLYRTKLAICGGLVALIAIGFVVLGSRAYANAVPLPAERVLIVTESCGKHCQRENYYRADGSPVWFGTHRAPLASAPGCAQVQLLAGKYGFAWLRILERSRIRQRGQLAWPVRASECFSDIPLSSLPR